MEKIKVFATVQIFLIDTIPNFFKKLREFVGEFSIEGMADNFRNDTIVISFYTDKVSFIDGEERRVDLVLKDENNEVNFIDIIK